MIEMIKRIKRIKIIKEPINRFLNKSVSFEKFKFAV
jgi:hypothetical protein